MKDEDFQGLMEGLHEAATYLHGHAVPGARVHHVAGHVDVKAIRQRLHMTQAAFAARFGFSKGAVADWEQRRRFPEASARVLLTVIDREPEAVMRALDVA